MTLQAGTAIAVDAGHIVDIDESSMLEQHYTAETTLDGSGKVAGHMDAIAKRAGF